jgi:Asp-tRNA(Asn)/Glu-tRNA(Gln) amidotransferase A subunit family amidase
MAYDDFLASYSKATEECLLVFGSLQEREEKLSAERAEEMVVGVLREKREREVKGIRAAVSGLVEQLRKLEKEMIAVVDQTVSYKQAQLMGGLRWGELAEKKAGYQATVDLMSQGIEEVLNLDDI